MRKDKIIIKWPFKKGERVKLSWISEPYKYNNKWMIDTYFDGEYGKRKITLDLAVIHLLVKDKYYIDGDLNSSEDGSDTYIEEIKLRKDNVNYSERDWGIWYGGNKIETKAKSFTFFKKNSLYVIPIYEIEGNTLSIHFTSQYNKTLLKSERINHLAWLLTNPNAFRVFNMVGQNVRQREGLKLDFLLKNFSIKARVRRCRKDIKILEVLGLKRKRINVEEINIYHPSLEETEASSEVKKRKYIGKGIDGKVHLTSDANGSTNAFDVVNTLRIEHEYEFLPYIRKRKTGRKIRRDKKDETTKPYIIDSGNVRTTADEGGQDLIKGLEFKSLDSVVVKGELEEFIEVLKLLEKRLDIGKVEIIVG